MPPSWAMAIARRDFSDRVHGCGHQGNIQFYLTGQAGLERDIGGNHLGIAREQQYIVKGEGFLGNSQHCRSPAGRFELNVQL